MHRLSRSDADIDALLEHADEISERDVGARQVAAAVRWIVGESNESPFDVPGSLVHLDQVRGKIRIVAKPITP